MLSFLIGVYLHSSAANNLPSFHMRITGIVAPLASGTSTRSITR
jgi:hypothetical protein